MAFTGVVIACWKEVPGGGKSLFLHLHLRRIALHLFVTGFHCAVVRHAFRIL